MGIVRGVNKEVAKTRARGDPFFPATLRDFLRIFETWVHVQLLDARREVMMGGARMYIEPHQKQKGRN